MATWKEKGPARFAIIAFPWNTMNIRGGMRYAHHKARHVDGSITELLGRETYEVKFTIPADNGLLQYPNFLDVTWPKLRTFFELGAMDTLDIPGVGAVEAWAATWEEDAKCTSQQGAAISVTFYENTNRLFLNSDAVGRDAGSLPTVVSSFSAERAAYVAAPRSPTMSVQRSERVRNTLANLETTALTLLAYKDKYELYARAQLTQVDRILDLAGAATEDLAHEIYKHQTLRDATSDLWATTRRFKSTVVVLEPMVYVTPFTGTVSQFARQLYGAHRHILDILHLNVLPDPNRIATGTKLIVPRPTQDTNRRRRIGSSV